MMNDDGLVAVLALLCFSPVICSSEAGPSTIAELFTWPVAILDDIQNHKDGAVLMQQLATSLSNELFLTTHYSGMDVPGHVMCFLAQRLEEKGIITDSKLRYGAACDIMTLAQEVLNSFPVEHRPDHIHGDILDRLPYNMRVELQKAFHAGCELSRCGIVRLAVQPL